jgi:phosphate starvation-inducible protein PhoH
MLVLIFGPCQLGVNIDVYLRPLIDDFKELWKEEGIRLYDVFRKEHFNLCAMLFTTITDILGHHSMSEKSKGEKDYFQCLDDVETVWLNNSKKRVYVRHRRFLPKSHPYWEIKH